MNLWADAVPLHVTAQFVRVIVQLALGGIEGVVQGCIKVGMFFVIIALVVNVNFPAGDANVDANVKWCAFALMSRGRFDHDVAGNDAVEEFFEFFHVFAYACFDSGGGIHVAECNL
jgi:hypothetical protein